MQNINRSGLSLIEVLAALGIMAIVLVAMGGGFNQSLNATASSRNQLAAVSDTRRILEHARKVTDSYGLTGTNSVTDQNAWDLWISTSQNWQLPNAIKAVTFPAGTSGNPLQVRATVTWSEKQGTKSYHLDTLITRRTLAS